MKKKTHIGRHGTPKCATGMSMHMVGRSKPSITVTAEQFSQFPAGALNLPTGKTTFKATIHHAGSGEFMRLNGIHLQRLPNSR